MKFKGTSGDQRRIQEPKMEKNVVKRNRNVFLFWLSCLWLFAIHFCTVMMIGRNNCRPKWLQWNLWDWLGPNSMCNDPPGIVISIQFSQNHHHHHHHMVITINHHFYQLTMTTWSWSLTITTWPSPLPSPWLFPTAFSIAISIQFNSLGPPSVRLHNLRLHFFFSLMYCI